MDKTDLVAVLKRQLKAAEERADRWNNLEEHMRGTNRDVWRAVATLRRSEIESIKVLVRMAENDKA